MLGKKNNEQGEANKIEILRRIGINSELYT